MSARFYLYPETFIASLTHPTESLFVPAAVVSFGTILLNITQYGLYNVGDWLNEAALVMFWINSALAIIASAGTYLMLWTTTTFTIAQMTPIWIFPAYPLLVIGPQAALLSKSLAPDQAKIILLAGFTIQGIGYLVSLMIYAAYIYRLMTQKLPAESSRPGMFVSVGPSGFTAGAVINMSSNIGRAFGPDYMGEGNGKMAALVLKLVADWMSLWVWGYDCFSSYLVTLLTNNHSD
jgi:tellurite resistance protein TehA-like permease